MNHYKVLARKYRPQNFTDLIGQDNMVKVISNSFSSERVHHAYIFTGIRGVGKTTTARIIAKALNCIGHDGQKKKPDMNICGTCVNCVSIMEDRHPDCLEMDAASKTSIEDVKEIIDFTRYLPVMGRNKVIIIDEVHMLSNKAFNALLKTLEEPPANVVFIFATTEMRKIPITIVSRCQKFELRRLSNLEIFANLANICKAEAVDFEDEALNIIASSSEGSVRDSLSLLDQAINHSDDIQNKVTADSVIKIIGRSSNEDIIKLFNLLIDAEAKNAVELVNNMLLGSIQPASIVEMLLELTHKITMLKNGINLATGIHLGKEQLAHVNNKLNDISLPVLTRLWQMLTKGFEEMRSSFNAKLALEMLIIRVCFVKNYPTPLDLLSGNMSNNTSENVPDAPSKVMSKSISSFDDIINLCEKSGKLIMANQLKRDVRLVKFKENFIEINLFDAPKSLVASLKIFLDEETGKSWTVIASESVGEITIKEKLNVQNIEKIENAKSSKHIKQILDTFPKSKVISVDDIVLS